MSGALENVGIIYLLKRKQIMMNFHSLPLILRLWEMNFGPRVYTPGSPGLFSGHVKYEPVPRPGFRDIVKSLLHKDEDLGGETALSQNNEPRFIGMCGMNWNEEYSAVEIEYMLLPQFWAPGAWKSCCGKDDGSAGSFCRQIRTGRRPRELSP